MSSVNGVASAPTFEKYQGSEKSSEARVGAGGKNQGSLGVGGGSKVSRGRLDVEGKKAPGGGKTQKADPFKEILKMLKGLLETLSTLIGKLSNSASGGVTGQSSQPERTGGASGGTTGGASSTSTNSSITSNSPSSTSSQTTTSSSANSNPTGVGNSGSSASAGAGEGAGSAGASGTVGSGPTSGPTAGTTDTAVTAPSVPVIVGSNDDLSVREESESGRVSTPTSSVIADQKGEGLQALKDETGAVSVLTDDGFTIRADVKDQAWTIAGPDGFSTRIWGDPHVTESDGDKWDFLKQSTFLFGKNKVTVEVVPAGNGMTYSSRISVYSGDDRVTISGIETNKPTIEAVARDGEQHDAQLSDGVIFTRGNNTRGESWSQVVDGKKDVMGH